jgi:hypothetical protein
MRDHRTVYLWLGGLASLVLVFCTGAALGLHVGRKTAGTQAMFELGLSRSAAQIEFADGKAPAAWASVSNHQSLVLRQASALDDFQLHTELMLVATQLALLAPELGRDEKPFEAEALLECGKAQLRSCTTARLQRLAKGRSSASHRAAP